MIVVKDIGSLGQFCQFGFFRRLDDLVEDLLLAARRRRRRPGGSETLRRPDAGEAALRPTERTAARSARPRPIAGRPVS